MKVVKYILAVLAALIVLVLAGVGLFILTTRPSLDGEILLPGLKAKVEVIRDDWGVPHLFAEQRSDLHMALGYVMAQDRLFHMDFLRRVGRGRLAEILGPDLVETDHFLRVLNAMWPEERADKSVIGPYRQAVEEYAAGVNAFIRQGRLPLEFTILGYKPEPWKVTDGIYVNLLMGWDLQTGWSDLLFFRLMHKVGLEMAEEAIPVYPGGGPTIVPKEVTRLAGLLTSLYPLDKLAETVPVFTGQVGGSNGWAIAGKKTTTGRPILCQDPHLGLTAPSIWYEAHLQAEDLDVAGVMLPGLPVVVIGNNRRIAWGCTNVMLDDMDFYVEKLNPQNPDQYEYQGRWEQARVIQTEIKVKGGAPVTKKIRITRHGPIINDVQPGLDQALAMRWTLNDGLGGAECFMDLNTAGNWEEFKSALKKYHGPAQNMPYADMDGNIGYYTAGRIPIRAAKADGLLPLTGWDGAHEWRGYVPFEENPHLFNPEQGFVVVANNQTAPEDYPHYISRYFVAKYRAARITDLIQAKPKLSVADNVALQNDVYSLEAAEITPIILSAFQDRKNLEPEVAAALDYLRKWDFRADELSVASTLFHETQLRLMDGIFKDKLGQELYQQYLKAPDLAVKGFQAIMHHEKSKWFEAGGGREQVIRRSLEAAVAGLKEKLGPDPSGWQWGRLHMHRSGHVIFKDVKYLGALFNIGPYPLPGSKATVAPAAYPLGQPYITSHGASTREIIDFSNRDNDLRVISSGCSGQVFSRFYDNQNRMWRAGQYHPVLMDRDKVEKHARARLVLKSR
ncbi:MAG: penicillin acylase family protein [Thermodesulfobacteriota bacterium]